MKRRRGHVAVAFVAAALLLSAGLLWWAGALPGRDPGDGSGPGSTTSTTSTSSSTAPATLPTSTAPGSESGSVLVVYATGDAALAEIADIPRALADHVPLPGEGLDLFLYLGDVYPSGSPDDFRLYDAIWGETGRDLRARTMSVIGNHESDNRDEGWIPYWRGETASTWQGSLTVTEPTYYAVKMGGWKFIALDTNVDVDADSDQHRFLVGELSEPGFRSIVFGHHPRWSSGKHGDDGSLDDAWKAMVEGGAVAYLSGHEHNSQIQPMRDARGGAVDQGGCIQLVAGAGGAELYGFESGEGQSTPSWGDDENHAILRMTLRTSEMEVAFIDGSGAALTTRTFLLEDR